LKWDCTQRMCGIMTKIFLNNVAYIKPYKVHHREYDNCDWGHKRVTKGMKQRANVLHSLGKQHSNLYDDYFDNL
jgi:hypothetical protein